MFSLKLKNGTVINNNSRISTPILPWTHKRTSGMRFVWVSMAALFKQRLIVGHRDVRNDKHAHRFDDGNLSFCFLFAFCTRPVPGSGVIAAILCVYTSLFSFVSCAIRFYKPAKPSQLERLHILCLFGSVRFLKALIKWHEECRYKNLTWHTETRC